MSGEAHSAVSPLAPTITVPTEALRPISGSKRNKRKRSRDFRVACTTDSNIASTTEPNAVRNTRSDVPGTTELSVARTTDFNLTRTKSSTVTSNVDAESWGTPWSASLGMTEYDTKEQRLHDEIVAYVTYILPTKQERRARAKVIARVGDVVNNRFPNVTLAIFGSVAQDLYLPDGDVDLVMNVAQDLDPAAKKKMLFQLAHALRMSHLSPKVQVIPHARVPVLSFETTRELGSFKIDISINSGGVEAIPKIASYLNEMPALRYLVTLCKGFLSFKNLNSASEGGLSSYSIICMVISFLQLNPKERSVAAIENPLENESLGTLFLDLLDYYGNTFPYASSYISVTQKALLPKRIKGWNKEKDSLSIECLVNPENDIGRPTSKIAKVRGAFNGAHRSLQDYPFGVEYGNVLGTILRASGETLAHREHVRKIVDTGSLELALTQVNPAAWRAARHPKSNPRTRPPTVQSTQVTSTRMSTRQYMQAPPSASSSRSLSYDVGYYDRYEYYDRLGGARYSYYSQRTPRC
ncbi:hypothetical protein BKA93DRAFT_54235 [Sparassis latifolia]